MRALAVALALLATAPPAGAAELDGALATRLASLALACVHREYPGKIAHVLRSDADVRPPRQLTPAFYGCYDWHSAVHAHWLLVRLVRGMPAAPFAPAARQALERSLTAANLAAEAAYLAVPERATFERPYGLAWALTLAAELAEWNDADARRWAGHLAPLEEVAARRLAEWLPKLSRPIRTGEHDNTAFALGLVADWAVMRREAALGPLARQRGHAFFFADRDCPIDWEPGGHDFLSPCLAEADLARRHMEPVRFAAWLGAFLPRVPVDGSAGWLPIAHSTDAADGKLAHLDGLNLSRAWMLAGIASGLPEDDPRRPSLLAASAAHRLAGLAAVTGEHYAGGHWLGTFAVYLETARGLRPDPPAPAR